MAKKNRSHRARTAHRVLSFIKGATIFGLVVLAHAGFADRAGMPELQVPAFVAETEIPAKLSYSGTDVVITGSIANFFDDATFEGPNRAAKVDRDRPMPDALAIAESFDGARSQIALLRTQAAQKAASAAAAAARISVASIDPKLTSEALSAIEDVQLGPRPVEVPETLAYARANTPATVFKKRDAHKVSEKQLWCLATAIYFEARGESYRGQVAVAQVVLNRVKHRLYPSTICGVVFQNQAKRNACQFSFACDGIPERVNDKTSWKQATEIAEKVTDGELYLTEVANATHYHANYVYPRWAPRLRKMTTVGLHIFYRFKNG